MKRLGVPNTTLWTIQLKKYNLKAKAKPLKVNFLTVGRIITSCVCRQTIQMTSSWWVLKFQWIVKHLFLKSIDVIMIHYLKELQKTTSVMIMIRLMLLLTILQLKHGLIIIKLTFCTKTKDLWRDTKIGLELIDFKQIKFKQITFIWLKITFKRKTLGCL